jgi:hypothetical protein
MTIKRKFSESAIDQEDGSERRLRSGRTTSFVTASPVTNTKSTGSPSRVSPRKRIQPLKADVAQKDDVDSECSLKTLKHKEIKTQKVSKNRSDAVKDQLIPVEEASQLYGDYGAGIEPSSTTFFLVLNCSKRETEMKRSYGFCCTRDSSGHGQQRSTEFKKRQSGGRDFKLITQTLNT